MNDKLLIIGAGGHGRVVADIAKTMDKWRKIFFCDDNETGTEMPGMEVMGRVRDAFSHISDYDIFVAVGNNASRERLMEELFKAGASIPVLVHPLAVMGSRVSLGEGTVVMAGVVINCCSRIGKGCIINTGSTVDHDNIIEDYVHISPGANLAGTVRVGARSWIGIGCTVSNNISITGGCMTGAGAVVVADIHEPGTYIGIPAKKMTSAGIKGNC